MVQADHSKSLIQNFQEQLYFQGIQGNYKVLLFYFDRNICKKQLFRLYLTDNENSSSSQMSQHICEACGQVLPKQGTSQEIIKGLTTTK